MKLNKIITLILLLIIGASTFSPQVDAEPEPTPIPKPTIEMIDIRDYWAEHPEESPIEEIRQATAMANVAQAVCPDGASENCLISVMACVWNRAHTVGFPNTIEEVASQPRQWEGLTSDSCPSNENIKLARKLVKEWQSSYSSPISKHCVYLRLDTDGIWFRSQWKGEDEIFIAYN